MMKRQIPSSFRLYPAKGTGFIAKVTSAEPQIAHASARPDVDKEKPEEMSAALRIAPPVHETRPRFSAIGAAVAFLLGVIGVIGAVTFWQNRPKAEPSTSRLLERFLRPTLL